MSSTSSASETGPSPTRRGWIIALIVAITIGGGAALAFWPGSKPNADLASGQAAPANDDRFLGQGGAIPGAEDKPSHQHRHGGAHHASASARPQ